MNEEVKELLSRLKRFNEEQYLIEIDYGCGKLLLDYITNLQKERENLVHIVANKIIADYDIDTPLKEALNNERQRYIVLSTINNDLQQRIDKATEWIKEHITTYQKNDIAILDWDTFADPRNLLKILGGDE